MIHKLSTAFALIVAALVLALFACPQIVRGFCETCAQSYPQTVIVSALAPFAVVLAVVLALVAAVVAGVLAVVAVAVRRVSTRSVVESGISPTYPQGIAFSTGYPQS